MKYDSTTDKFYVISSQLGKIYVFKNNSGTVNLESTANNGLGTNYVRSFNIIDGYMYIISGDGYIRKIDYADGTFTLISEYAVPDVMYGMNFIEKIGDYWYITSTTNKDGKIVSMFIRTSDLSNLANSIYENLYSQFGFNSTPYYISNFDNKYFITEIGTYNSIRSFEVNNNVISNITTVYSFKKGE
ncbi:hypothetical protein [Clostridium saccharoperbutylacetonicum]|uniref:hypothetical protein n=1 Tax=Clostridium saccharoperbutylacetonicum TaxID=36745 RepID=UPI0039EAA386